jgi:hypothetical protein
MEDQFTPELFSVATQSIVQNANRLGLTWTLQLATVTEGNSPPKVSAAYDGDPDNAITMTSIIGGCEAGARVYAIAVPPSGNFIIGYVVPSTGLGSNGYNNTDDGDPASGTTTSLTYVDMPGPMSFQVRKYFTNSRLRLFMSGSWFDGAPVAGTSAGFGLEISGGSVQTVDVDMSVYRATLPAGTVRLPIIAAEHYVDVTGSGLLTVTARWARVTGTGTPSVAIGVDFLSMSAAEVV